MWYLQQTPCLRLKLGYASKIARWPSSPILTIKNGSNWMEIKATHWHTKQCLIIMNDTWFLIIINEVCQDINWHKTINNNICFENGNHKPLASLELKCSQTLRSKLYTWFFKTSKVPRYLTSKFLFQICIWIHHSDIRTL